MRQILSAWITGILVTLLVGCAGASNVASRASSMQIDANTYIVQAGDTIESVAYRYQLTSSELAALNPSMTNKVYAGQPLAVRSGRRQIEPQIAKARQSRQTAQTSEIPASYRPDPAASSVIVSAVPVREVPVRENPPIVLNNTANRQVREEIIEESVATEALAQRAGVPLPAKVSANGWRWPVAGQVVRDYAPGQVNGQGIDIAGIPGQEIQVTADGTVIYAGRDLSDSGNLVIVRHLDGVLSTYSHARDLYVAENDTVRGGDPIASLGAISNRESVLHFGVRKNGKPVDPMGYLPNR